MNKDVKVLILVLMEDTLRESIVNFESVAVALS